jgi:hypothetical protein
MRGLFPLLIGEGQGEVALLFIVFINELPLAEEPELSGK